MLDIADPSNTSKVLQRFDTAGPANAVTLFHGYAYVAAGEAGLQVIPFVAADGSRELPVVTLETSSLAESAGEGNLQRLTAKVAAADQIRKVDFFLNGEKVASDGDYPFEYRYQDTGADPSDTVYACAEDIDGNSACTDPVPLNSKSKKTALQVTAVTPTEGGHTPRTKVAISAQFSLPLDVSTVAAKNVTLVKAATKTTPETTIPISAVTYKASSKSIAIQPKSTLAGGTYKVVLSSAIKSSNGSTMSGDYTWNFALDAVTDTWVSKTSGDWAVASNWTPGIGVPANGDSVIIAVPGVTVTMGTTSGNPVINDLTVGATNTLNIAGAGLSIQSSGVAAISGTLNLSSGSLNGPGTTTVSGAMTWKNGTISGVVDIPAKATLTIQTPQTGGAPTFVLAGGVINNSGTVTQVFNGTVDAYGYSGFSVTGNGAINNLAGGVWNVNGDVWMQSSDHSGLFTNSGTFNKAEGTNNTDWGVALVGAGPINVQSGTLSLNGGYVANTLGSAIAVSSGAVLNYAQGGTLDGGQVTGAGTLNFTASTQITGKYSFVGTTNITGGTVTFANATTIATLNLTGGTLGGGGAVTVSGAMTWKNGTISGVVDIPAKATLTIQTPQTGGAPTFVLAGGVINNSGTVTQVFNGTVDAYGYSGFSVTGNGAINNLAGGVWNVNGDVWMQSSDHSGLFTNSGTFNSNGNNNSDWSLEFNNSGTASINSGTLSLNGTYTTAIYSGTTTIAVGATLAYGQQGTLTNGSTSGAGTLNLTPNGSQATNIAGTYKIQVPAEDIEVKATVNAMNLALPGATVNVNGTMSAANLNLSNGALNVSGTLNASSLALSTANFTVNGTTSIGTLTVDASTGNTNGSNVVGSGSVSVTDTLNWNNGTVNVTGSFSAQNMTLAASSTFNFQLGGVPISVNSKLDLNGDISVKLTSSNPTVGTVFSVLSFANGYLGDFLDLLSIPIPGTSDYLNPTLTPSGLSFVVGASSSSSDVAKWAPSGTRAISAIQRRR